MQNPSRSAPGWIAITAGDPCGIGPEVILKAVAQARRSRVEAGAMTLAIIGDWPVFAQAAKASRVPLPRWDVRPWREASRALEALRSPAARAPRVLFFDLEHRERFVPGRGTPAAGRASLKYLEAALALSRRRVADAVVTGPLTKRSVEPWSAGFQGQTEWLARACGSPRVVMTFVAGGFRVALVTRHQGLRAVMASMRPEELRGTLVVLAEGLRRLFGIARPRLAVCGVNPHAGEGGMFGDEEARIIRPALRALRRRGMRVEGPFASDGFFPALLPPSPLSVPLRYDAVVCWYHDQGLIPFKLVARDAGCQVSIGLPIIRTAPDHGSALDIAGRGIANPGSMRAAIALAAELMRGRAPRGH
ncbi:MAG: 4-hydroxythreonine-4-phosphate dehydrogenase PdxA [Candidatus Omnitrophica bacterium]|nr:4-hydroxythreonine-4-phosphate dehydrogenase PdxA [Candidatus Omnitrophota bacterium]